MALWQFLETQFSCMYLTQVMLAGVVVRVCKFLDMGKILSIFSAQSQMSFRVLNIV